MFLKGITAFLRFIKYCTEPNNFILSTIHKWLSSLHPLRFPQGILLALYDYSITFHPFDDTNNNFYKFSFVPGLTVLSQRQFAFV